MTHEDITRMAREAGLFVPRDGIPRDGALARFAALAYAAGAAAERDKCRYPDCVDNGPGGKCTRWLVGECEGPKIGGQQ